MLKLMENEWGQPYMENHTIHVIAAEDEQFLLCHPDETVLASLQEHGFEVRTACTNGACGVCLTKLLEGDIDYGLREPFGLNQKELAQGYILPCIARCKSHISIGPPPVR